MNKKIISSFDIDLSNLPAVATTRSLTVSGDKDAEFILNAYDASGNFYNFTSNAFAAGFSSQNNLVVKLNGSDFIRNISFPASSSATYTLLLLAKPNTNTELSVGGNTVTATRVISQVGNAQITFTLDSGTVDASSYAGTLTDTNVTSTGSPISVSKTPVQVRWTVTNASSDARGYGLRIDPDKLFLPGTRAEDINWDSSWFYQTTETVDGTTSSSTSVVVDDLTNLAVGMELTYKTGTTAAAAGTKITAIDVNTKTLTLSVANSLTDGNTMTFRAYGSKVIEKATGMSIDFGSFDVTSAALTKTVRADSDGDFTPSTTITLNGTYGISGGNVVTYAGARVDSSASNAVSTVSASSSAGSIVVQNAQTLRAGTLLTFKGSTQSMKIIGDPIIKKYPSSNTTVYLDLNKFITIGTDGS